jgi:RNA polymerase sigma-70 factor (ECF subfamily)
MSERLAQARLPRDLEVSTTPADRRLVEAVRAGDARAAAPLYASLRPSIERALYRVLRGRPPEFEDLMQATYERVMRATAQGQFDGRSQLKTWAGSIAAHTAIDHIRRRSQEQKLCSILEWLSVDQHSPNCAPERQLEARSEVLKVQGVLRRMKRRHATVLVMHDALGHSVPDVASHLGMNLSAARSTLRRARSEFARRYTSTSQPAAGGAFSSP